MIREALAQQAQAQIMPGLKQWLLSKTSLRKDYVWLPSLSPRDCQSSGFLLPFFVSKLLSCNSHPMLHAPHPSPPLTSVLHCNEDTQGVLLSWSSTKHANASGELMGQLKGATREYFSWISSGKVHPPLPPDSDFRNNFRFKGCQYKFSFSLTCHPSPLQLILTALSHFSHNSNPSMFAGIVSAIWEVPGGSGHWLSLPSSYLLLDAAQSCEQVARNCSNPPALLCTRALTCVCTTVVMGHLQSAMCWTVHSYQNGGNLPEGSFKSLFLL